MKEIEKTLRSLKDKKWHNLNNIKESSNLSQDKINLIIKFLEKQKFAKLNSKKDQIKITTLGMDYINLPT